MSHRTKALILAAGIGSRLRPLTDRLPKCLVQVRGRPIVDLWLEKLLHAGVQDVLINTHAHAEQVRDFVSQVNATGLMDVRECYEPVLLGSAGTIAANAAFADDGADVCVIYPDNVSQVDLAGMLAFHRGHDLPVTMLLFRAPNPRACGIATLNDRDIITDFVEKPTNPASDLANAGVYLIRASAYREIASMKGLDIGFDVLPRFVGRMMGYPLAGFHRDIGALNDLEQVEAIASWLDDLNVEPGNLIRPAVFLDRDGTIIEQVHYLRRPQDVRLVPGAAQAIRTLRSAGFACVSISNQSGIGRGELTLEDYHAVQAEVERQLAEAGTNLDGAEFCPIKPTTSDRRATEHPDRKPGPGMLQLAASKLGLSLPRSWMIGDLASDPLAGINAGCRGTVLLRSGLGPRSVSLPRVAGVHIADDLLQASSMVLALA